MLPVLHRPPLSTTRGGGTRLSAAVFVQLRSASPAIAPGPSVTFPVRHPSYGGRTEPSRRDKPHFPRRLRDTGGHYARNGLSGCDRAPPNRERAIDEFSGTCHTGASFASDRRGSVPVHII